MKKGGIIFVIMVVVYGVSFAQYVGVKSGVGFNNVDAELYIDEVNGAPRGLTSSVFGITSEFELGHYFSLVPELLYTQKGFSIDQGTSFDVLGIDVPIGARANTRIKYIELPLLAKGRFGNDKIKGYALAGAAVGRAIDAYVQPIVSVLVDIRLPKVPFDMTSGTFNATEFSGIIGGGLELPSSSGKFIMDARYQHSFTNALNDPIVDVSVRNKGMQVSVGYMFKI